MGGVGEDEAIRKSQYRARENTKISEYHDRVWTT